MAIKNTHTFEGLKYNLDNRDRVAASAALNVADVGAVTQITSATTAVTLNAQAGVITTFGAVLASAAEVEFTLTNSAIKGTDSVILTGIQCAASGRTGGANIAVYVHTIAAGSCKIVMVNTDDVSDDADDLWVIHFVVVNSNVA